MKKIIVGILIFVIFTNNVYASTYALIETTTGQIVEINGENEKINSGVLTKLMTALITAENIESGKISLNKLITVGNAVSKADAPIVWLTAGERITVDELLKGLLTGNANDCALALACVNDGTADNFVKTMNIKAKQIGMNNTCFKNCMNDCETTVSDMAILSCEISHHEILKGYMVTYIDYIRDAQTMLVNNNKLIKSFEGITGQIAGNTKQSGWCVAVSASRQNSKYACVLLGEEDKDVMFSKAKEILSGGFENYTTFTPSVESEKLQPISVKKGVEKTVNIKISGMNTAIIKKGEEQNIEYEIVTEPVLQAPVKENQVVGQINIKKNDKIILTSDIVTTEKIDKMTIFKYFILFVESFFK